MHRGRKENLPESSHNICVNLNLLPYLYLHLGTMPRILLAEKENEYWAGNQLVVAHPNITVHLFLYMEEAEPSLIGNNPSVSEFPHGGQVPGSLS